MANGMTRKDIRELLKDQDFLDQNLERFGMDSSTLPIGPAGVLRTVKGGGMLGAPSRPLVPTGGGRPAIPGSATTIPSGSSRALPAPRSGKLGALLTLLTMGGVGAYNLLSNGEEEPPVDSINVPPVDPETNGNGTTVITPPGDTWTPPPGLQTGLDFIADRRRSYIESISGSLGQAAILNLMEKGAGDKFLKQIEGDVEQQEAFKDDEYIAKINKAIFSKPYRNSKELFDRLIKAEIPIDLASQITGYIPQKKQVTYINPRTKETYSADEGSIPEAGFRRVDPTIDKSVRDRTYETSEALEEAVRIGGLEGAEYLARYIYLKGGRGTEATYEDALKEAKEMMKVDERPSSIPVTHRFDTEAEAEAAVEANPELRGQLIMIGNRRARA